MLINQEIEDISLDVDLIVSKPKIQGNDNKLLANDTGLDARITSNEQNIVTLKEKVFGELFSNENTVPMSLTQQNTWYKAQFLTTGISNGTTPSIVTNDITVITTGIYKVEFTSFSSGTNNAIIQAKLFKNNGTVSFENIQTERKFNTVGDIATVTACGFINLEAGDKIEVWARCTSGSNAQLISKFSNLNIIKV